MFSILKLITSMLFCLICCAVTVTTQQISRQPNTLGEAERIWELAIQAKGGREKLYAVENMVVSSRITTKHGIYKKKDAQLEQFYVFPSKLWIWNDTLPIGAGIQLEMINMEIQTQYVLYPTDLKNPLRKRVITNDEDQPFLYAQLLFLLESRWQKPRLTGYRVDSIGSRKYDVVETILDRDKHDIFFDQQTHLPVQIIDHYGGSFSERTTDYIYKLEDYEMIDGIPLPTKVYGRTYNGVPETLNFQINVQYDKSIFEKPPSADAGPEAWKARN